MKRVQLTWRNNGKKIVEECLLVEDTDPIFVGNVQINVTTDEGVGNTVETIHNGMVVFEDDYGLFYVSPADVIDIKEL